MEPLRQLRSDDVSEFLRAAAVSARAHAPGIDHLDHLDQLEGIEGGNAGSNVAATLEALVARLTAGETLTGLASLLEGARAGAVGTAGNMVAEFLAGLGELCRNTDALDPTRLAMGFEVGVERLVDVVGEERPGGIPSVATVAARTALRLADEGIGMADLVLAVAEDALDALEATTDLRPPLAEAGVVDAGAAAFVVVLDALVATVHGEDPEVPEWEFVENLDPELSESERFRYVVSLRLAVPERVGTPRSAEEMLAHLTAAWRALGDEVTTGFADDGAVWASIATDDIGPVIEAAIGVGRPYNIAVDDTRG